METLVELASGIRLDPDAFQRNDDGTWTVLMDTKIYYGSADPAHTLLLPGGTEVDAHTSWAIDVDLVNLLETTRRDDHSGNRRYGTR